jgi:predicted RNA-binding protein with TRAM domain
MAKHIARETSPAAALVHDPLFRPVRYIRLLALLLLVGGSWAAAQSDGSWTGSTGQGSAVSFTVLNGGAAIQPLSFGFSGACGSGTTTVTSSTPISGGSFSVSGGFCPSYSMQGTFSSATTASGSLVLTYTYIPYACPCSGSINTTWSATKNCSTTIVPESADIAAGGATGTVVVTSDCAAWTVVSNDSWITVTSGSSGSGNGTVAYSVAVNAGAPRTGTITIGPRTFIVNQAQEPGTILITSANSATFEVGLAGAFAITTSGAPTPTLSAVGALPSDVTFTDNGNGTATLSGTPASGNVGIYPLTITAHNGVATDFNQIFILTVYDALAFPSGGDGLSSAVIDQPGGFAYFGTDTTPGTIVKVRLSDLTQVGTLTLSTGEDSLTSAVIDPDGGFAYFGTDTSPGTIVKVRLSDFSRVDALTLNAGEDSLLSAVIDPGSGFAYFCTYTSPGAIVKVRLSDLTRVGVITLGAGEDSIAAAVIDPSAGFAYFGTDALPGVVVKVRLSDFTRVGTLTLGAGEDHLWCGVIDQAAGFAYFGTASGMVIKVRLSDLTKAGTLTLDPGENRLWSAVKVRLADFSRGGAITLGTGQDYLECAVIDPTGGFAYFGTYTSPGIIVRVPLSSGANSRTGYFPVTPCRVFDTRVSSGNEAGAPVLSAGESRLFAITGKCGVPADAKAISANLTVVGATAAGDLRVIAGNLSSTITSALSIPVSRARANNAIVQLSTSGDGTIAVINSTSGPVHVILDVNGHFR